MRRRNLLLGLAAAGIGAALVFKPEDVGAPYSPYFEALNELLKKDGPHRPALLIDLDKLDQNIEALRKIVPAHMGYRIVAKSLPSPQLLSYIIERTGTQRLMVFHQAFLKQTAVDFPSSDVLLGKPMPVKAAAAFYGEFAPVALAGGTTFDPQRQLQWLIDTDERLAQYQQLAATLGTRMRINMELDVGLHRGGLRTPEQLRPLLDRIMADPQHLEWSGFMGYDPHVIKLPRVLGSPETVFAESQAIYRGFIDWAKARYPQVDVSTLCLNGAGSPSMLLHREGSVINDLSAGSCLVKPTDFDLPTLEDFEPAAYIATPVLKRLSGIELPGLESIRNVAPRWNPNWQQTYFMYGGKWSARIESPAGLRGNGLYGTSSNQEIVNGSRLTQLDVDDHIFLRPHQSEAIFLEFGDLLAVRSGEIVARWPVLNQ
jgi:D-serine deaminase-like pyridoxal phosphate-dependent protein